MRFLPCLFILLLKVQQANSQFADQGTGALKQQIWWFDWNGFSATNGATKTFTTTEGVTVTIKASNVTGQILVPKIMNTWPGAILHLLYNFSDGNIKPALYSDQNTVSSHISLTITATRNGQPTPFTLVFADAEASTADELTHAHTTGSPWRTLEFYRNSSQNSNPVAGCNTNDIIISDTYGNAPTTGQNPIEATDASTSGILNIDVTLDKKVFGGMAIAMGIFAPTDRGDLPASYGNVQHALNFTSINPCNYQSPFPSLIQSQSLKLGNIPGDSDGQQTADDNASGLDEDAVANFPAYDASGNYSLDIPLSNTTTSNAYLSAWFDMNNDGVFSASERIINVIAPGTTIAKLIWTNVPPSLPAAQNFAFRFRYSSDLLSVQSANGFAPDGEAEDYLTPLICTLKLSVSSNASLCEGKSMQLNVTGADNYSWLPTGGLSDASVSNPVTNVTQSTDYIVTGTKGGCTGKDTISITVIAKPTFAVAASSVKVCRNDTVRLTATGGDFYKWIEESTNMTTSTNSSFSYSATSSQNYYVIIESVGCQLKDTLPVSVTVSDPPLVTITKSNDIDCGQLSSVLTVTGGNSYLWSGSNISSATSSAPSVSPKQTATYNVTVRDANGCNAIDSIIVNVDFTKGAGSYFMPNAFTPNGDGKNDCFGLKYSGGISSYELNVYNRIGALLFRTTDPSSCWNGIYKGQPVNAGTYVYTMRADGTCSKVSLKGTVVVIR